MFRAGDKVRHRPTGETWILAVDQFGDEVFPCGWLESKTDAKHCTLIEAATDEARWKQLAKSSAILDRDDTRQRLASWQIAESEDS